MTFPTTPILDDFNRPDEGPPPSANWITPVGVDGLVVLSNELAGDPAGGGGGGAIWNTALTLPIEGYFTMATRPDDTLSVVIGWTDLAGQNGYMISAVRDDTDGDAVGLARIDGGVLTTLIGPLVITMQNGDAFGLTLDDGIATVHYRPVSGAWGVLGSAIDATYQGSRYLSLAVYDNTARLDDFGGGTITVPEPPNATEPTMVFSQCGPEPILRINDGTEIIDLLANDSGWELEDPYWNPQIAQYKSGGSYVNAGLAEGQRLVHKEYDNVIETIPLSVRGINQNRAIQTIRRLLQKARQASDYWTKPYEYDDVWIEAKPAGSDCLIGYARVIKMSIPELTNPFGQPFFSSFNEAIMNGITLTVEREPLWRGVPPGEIIGPLYNLVKNPDFELWNFGTVDSQSDSWTDLETIQITGQNSRELTSPHSGLYSLKIRVSGSTLAGRIKGITQAIENIKDETEYTVVAWVRSEGVSNGVGRILVTYSSQLEVYRASTRHGWTLYTGKFTTGTGDSVAVNLEILTTAANTDGTIYVDSLMLLEGNWKAEATNGTLPYLSGSHIVNHWDQTGSTIVAGDINWVDVWNVPGDEDALVRLELMNNSEPADFSNPVEQYSLFRIGQRRTKDVLNFENFFDPAGTVDATASGGFRLDSAALNPTWQTLAIRTVTNAPDNVGRYRVFARVYDSKAGTPNLGIRAKYFLGTALVGQKILQDVTAPIRGDWCVVNLTENAAMILEQKFAVDFPSQLGYAIEMSRPTGTDAGELDYVLSMPTDGGYVEVEIDPALAYLYNLVISSESSLTIGGGVVSKPWQPDFIASATNAGQIFSMIDYNGSLYVGLIYGNIPNIYGQIWRKRAGVWSKVFDDNYPVTGIPRWADAMAIFQGNLYVALDAGHSSTAYLYRSSDGETFSNVYTLPVAVTQVTKMVAYGSYLYIGTTTGTIERFDGTTSITFKNKGAGTEVYDIKILNNQMYVLWNSVPGDLDVYDFATGVWSTVATSPGSGRWRMMEVFNGAIYIGNTPFTPPIVNQVVVSRYGGGTGTTNFSISDPTMTNVSVRGLVAYNNRLYAIQLNNRTLESDDGISWRISVAGIPFTENAAIISDWESAIHGGQLYIGTSTFGFGIGYVNFFVNSDITYKAASFKGSPFTSPPEKRHRYVFSYDRANYINNISDRALIGLGFVPRYLSLRGAN